MTSPPMPPAHFSDQSRYAIRCEWGPQGLHAIAAGVDLVIVFDILSYSTAVEVAVNRGALVYPHPWKDASAEARAAELGATLALGRGKGEFSLSPVSMRKAAPGQKLVLPSPNGAMVSLAAATVAPHVICGSFRNLSAVVAYARQFQKVALIPAGERWPDGSLRPAIEDIAAAGAVAARLDGGCSPEAQAAIGVWRQIGRDLPAHLLECASGRQLAEMGYTHDVEMAAELDISQSVPVQVDGCYRRHA